MVAEKQVNRATGRRKTAVARVILKPGTGTVTVNNKPFEVYFQLEQTRQFVLQPLAVTSTTGKFDIQAQLKGGGPVGQSGALRHGLARALIAQDASLRAPLKAAGFLTRDPRMKERKKAGQPGARRRFQFSKR